MASNNQAAELLARELATYRSMKKKLVAEAQGKFALIKGDRVIGTFALEDEAIAEGYDRFGIEPFLVHLIEEIEVPEEFLSNHIEP